jgi:tetratricopeptide (TPR) repeat protein
MNSNDKNSVLRQVFEGAGSNLGPQQEPRAAHIMEDDDLLTRLSLDQLRLEEREHIERHLSTCNACRSELATLVKEGVLELPQGHDDEQRNRTPARELSDARPRRTWVLAGAGAAILALAAAIVLAVILWHPNGGSDQELARAQTELKTGHPDLARARLAKLLDSGKLGSSENQDATHLFEQACVAEANIDLAANRFTEVAELDRDARARGIKSGQLANLKIQADREMPVQVAMADKGSLLDYGYFLNGEGDKATEPLTPKNKEIGRELEQAVQEHQGNVDLLLNRGQFLLKHGSPQDAHKVFAQAHELEPGNVHALVGMGIANYAMNELKSAHDRFREALDLEPDNGFANLNMGIYMESQQRHADAIPYLKKAAETTTNPELRERIDKFLTAQK